MSFQIEEYFSIPLPPSVKKEEISKKQEVKGEEKQHHIDEPKLTKGRLDVNISGILITGQMTFYDIESKTDPNQIFVYMEKKEI